MALDAYAAAVLRQELADAAYDGLTADAAWAWLTRPVPQAPLESPSGVMLTPIKAAAIVGVAKAEAIAAAMRQAFPVTADHLLTTGVDPLSPQTQAFLDTLVGAGALTADDKAALVAAGTVTTPRPDLPRRYEERFGPARWPHVADDGSRAADGPAIHGFPNDITRAEFDAAWAAAGRS